MEKFSLILPYDTKFLIVSVNLFTNFKYSTITHELTKLLIKGTVAWDDFLLGVYQVAPFLLGWAEQNILKVCSSNGNDIKTKGERSFDLDFVFDIEAKRTCFFQNL